MINAPDEKPRVTWGLLKRVLGYAAPYRWHIAGMLVIILLSTGLSLLTPLIMRDLIDRTIPTGDMQRLIGLAVALLALPIAEQRDQRHQPAVQCAGGRRRHLRSARGALFPPAAHVAALFHQHPGGRIDEPPEQRCGRRAKRHQQHHRGHRSPTSSRPWRCCRSC